MSDSLIPKPDGGTIRYWARHIVTDYASDSQLEKLRAINPNAEVEFFTGEVVEDKLERWRPGDAMRSSLIISFDEKTLAVETENTLYQLLGPGRVTREKPKMYWEEVAITILLLSGEQDLQFDSGVNELIYPDTIETDSNN